MKNVPKLLAVFASLPLLGLGFAAMFSPNSMLDLFALTPRGTYGLNTIRADLGGLLIGSGLMIWIGLWKKQVIWFQATILLMGLLLFGRLISTVADGWTNAAIPAIVVEVFAVVVLSLNVIQDKR
jgi:hypothetical protein